MYSHACLAPKPPAFASSTTWAAIRMPARTARKAKNSVVLNDALVSVSRRGAGRWALWRPLPSSVRGRVAPGVVLMVPPIADGIRNETWSVFTAIVKPSRTRVLPTAGGGANTARSGGRPRADEAAGVELLGELDGVRRRPLAQVVRDDPHLEAALVRGVAPEPADEDVVVARGAGGGRVRIDEGQARHPLEQRARLLDLERVAGLEVHRLRMRVGHGHARTGDRDRHRLVAEDL